LQFAEGVGLPIAVAFLVPVAEVGGALLVLLGGVLGGPLGDLTTRIGALAFIPVMVGAIAMVHWPRWSFEPSESHPVGGMEFQVALILISLYLLLKGNNVRAGEVPTDRA
jgi:putative oxidoreductase